MQIDIYDNFERRCPRLGNPVKFAYCRTCGDKNTFCQKTADCWWEYFDIISYLKNTLPEDEFKALAAAKPKPKITSLMELIAQAKENNG
ncbi:Uncharacterized protein dnl_17740 [Desulfonema limicola]|uniref:Uncharacterized protein n=1 Tax=Desulfonema limicola TaxID=45656 RepID=A0A975B657_9BACT|nr:hypothetical protein [Desulfonema limicola]QTA79503.1 Uncharacterized protein dnl_17740 [Desulfonema limicola]